MQKLRAITTKFGKGLEKKIANEGDYHHKLIEIWNKPLAKIAVAKDIPRLCKAITITKNGETVIISNLKKPPSTLLQK